MRKSFLYLLMMLLGFSLFAQKMQTISLNNSNDEFTISKNQTVKFTLRTSFSSINASEIQTKEGLFTQLSVDGYKQDGSFGTPSLPAVKKLIEMPYGSDVSVNIVSYDEEVISLNDLGFNSKIYPLQPSMRKDQDPLTTPFSYKANSYNLNNYIDRPIAEVEYVGVLRSQRIGRLVIRPVQYNPVQNTLKIIKNLVLEVVFNNADLTLTEQIKNKYYSPCFGVSDKFLINHQESANKDVLTTYPVKYVIVSDRMFETQLQPFIQWKTKKGFNVVVAYTDVIGNTTSTIKSYLQGLYTSATPSDPAPSFVLFVGDVAQIPAFAGTALGGGHVSDLYYCEYTGDKLPECYYGRFSATNASELQPQIDKTLEYEKYLMPDPSFLNEVVMIAGQDANYGPLHGDGQINYGTSTYFNLAHNLISHTYLFAISGSSSSAIISNVSSGCSYANYTAHGNYDGWSSPSFNITNVASLTNAHKYPLMVGNCCLTNKFELYCFGEALLRAESKGAIGYIGGSNSTYWDEDYWWGVGCKTVVVNPSYSAANLGSYDRIFHDHGETYADWFVTQDQMIMAGNLAVTEGGTNYVDYYWEIYHLMGDPSLMPYLGVPPALSPVSYSNSLPLGPSTLTVTTEPYAYVGLSYNNALIDAQFTGSTGIVTLDISSITNPSTLDLVITKQNRQPYIGTFSLVPSTTPYVVYNNHTIHDAGVSANGSVEYSENVNMDLTLKNVGNVNATNITATLSTTNTDINITDNSEIYGNINASSLVSKSNAFAFNVNNVITDQQNAQFTITASDGGSGTWTTNFNVMLNAPVMQANSVVVNDADAGNGNGKLDPGETADIIILTSNAGHAVSPSANTTLTLNSGLVTIPTNNLNIGAINAGGNVQATYTINVDPAAPIGSTASFTYNVNAGGYTTTKTFTLTIGLIVEDFESNTFTEFPWNNTGTYPWVIDNNGSIYEGSFAAHSTNDSINNSVSNLEVQINVISADSLSFYKKVSSETGYDYLRFIVDNVQQGQWSGEVDWSRNAYYLTTGAHTLKWSYTKDESVSGGQDASWVDFIIFPPIQQALVINENLSNINNLDVYPNPVNSSSVVSFNLDKKSNVRIEILNSLGQTIKTIKSFEKLNEGYHSIPLSAKLSSGIYFCKVDVDNQIRTIKLIVTN